MFIARLTSPPCSKRELMWALALRWNFCPTTLFLIGILHCGNQYTSRWRESRLILWDALAAGRIAHGERWDFREIDSKMQIELRGRTILLNRTRIQPAELDPRRLGFTDDFNYVATLAIVTDELNDWHEIVKSLDVELSSVPHVYGGASALAAGGCVVKLLARSASDLLDVQTALWARARQIVLGRAPVDLRKY